MLRTRHRQITLPAIRTRSKNQPLWAQLIIQILTTAIFHPWTLTSSPTRLREVRQAAGLSRCFRMPQEDSQMTPRYRLCLSQQAEARCLNLMLPLRHGFDPAHPKGTPMTRFLIVQFLLPLALFGANPAMTDFNSNQFGTTGNKVVIKSGAALTNTAFTGTLTLNGGTFTNGGVTSGSVLSVSTRSAMEALAGLVDGTPVLLKGYYVQGDAPTVTYIYVAGDTSTVDDGSVITNASGRFKLYPQGGRVDIRTFGAIPDWTGYFAGSWTNGSTNIVLASAPSLDYVGKKIAFMRGNTSLGATVTANLTGSAVSSFTVSAGGQGYINTPAIVKTAGNGSGGSFTAVLTAGVLTSVTVGAGGTGYDANTAFGVKSTDVGTTNAPYFTAAPTTVLSQSGSNLTVTLAPTFTAQLNSSDAPSYAVLYTENSNNIQRALTYAGANGLETYIPGGNFGSGPLYLVAGQKVTGGGKNISFMHLSPKVGISTFRKALFAPKNINGVNGRHLTDTLLADVDIGNFTINGEANLQSPLGTDLNNGLFAIFGINCIAVENWNIHDMIITNTQGAAIYFGSGTPTGGSSGDWAAVQSLYIKVDRCRFIGNWRQAHQMSNAKRITETDCELIDSSLGYYSGQVLRNLDTGTSIGEDGTYSPEQIDLEANNQTTSGLNKFVNCWMQNQYGKAADLFYDQEHTDFIHCTFYNCRNGAITSSSSSGAGASSGLDSGSEWSIIDGCRFISTSTNNGAHLQIKSRGIKVVNCYFEGKTSATVGGNHDVIVDGSGYAALSSPTYLMNGNMFANNTFNLYPTDGTVVAGAMKFFGANSNFRDFFWANNNIIQGVVDMRIMGDRTEGQISALGAASYVPQGYAYQTAAGGTPDYQSENITNGFGSQDWTIQLQYAMNSSTTKNGELFRWTSPAATEIIISDKITLSTNFLTIAWNPTNVGSRTINVPIGSIKGAFGAVEAHQLTRPVNLTVTKTHGSVYAFAVTAGGTGYTSAPTVTVATGSATGTAQISAAGVVTNIYVSAMGSSYTTNPVVTLSGGGGSGATATASAGRLDVYLDDTLVFTDYGIDIITTMSSGVSSSFSIGRGTGTQARAWYGVSIWNRALNEQDIRQAFTFGPAQSDRWGFPNGTLGCFAYVRFNTGIGYWFPDLSGNGMHVWTGQATTHSIPKTTGQIIKRIARTTTGVTSFNVAVAASDCIPANSRITSIYAISISGGAPTVTVGFDATAVANPITSATTLTASVTNYLPLVQDYIYGSTNRPLYVSSTAGTNIWVINYTQDQGKLSGPFLGFQDASSAAAGDIGETLTSAVAVTGAFNMATTVVTNVTSLSLTPGRWIVYGNANFTGTNSTITAMSAGITSTTATIPTDGTEQNSWVALTTTSFKDSIAVKPKAFTVSTTTPVYLVMVGTFSTANSVGAYGSMIAQRQ